MKHLIYYILFLYLPFNTVAQHDSLLKIHHAEPLYVDLIRDLGARKGEREWNIGYSFNNLKNFYTHSGFIEYEFAPINRLGLEIEIPFSFTQNLNRYHSLETPRHRMEGIKLSAQYTFLVSESMQTSMAIGYTNEIKLHSFQTIYDNKAVIKGNEYNPFFILAKRWAKQFHSLIYTGPVANQLYETGSVEMSLMFNASIHYIIPNTQHFVGIELNNEYYHTAKETILHPQAKIKISDGLFLGMVVGIPLHTTDNRYSCMFRLIYEPKKKVK